MIEPSSSRGLWPGNTVFYFETKCILIHYFTSGENIIDSSGNEGLIIKVTSEDGLGAPNGTRYINLQIYYNTN